MQGSKETYGSLAWGGWCPLKIAGDFRKIVSVLALCVTSIFIGFTNRFLGCQNIITKTLVCSNIWNITALIKHEISQSVSFTREKLHQLTNLILLAPGNVLIYNLYVSLFFSGKPSWNLGNSQKIYLGQNGWFNNFWVPFWTSTLSWEIFTMFELVITVFVHKNVSQVLITLL